MLRLLSVRLLLFIPPLFSPKHPSALASEFEGRNVTFFCSTFHGQGYVYFTSVGYERKPFTHSDNETHVLGEFLFSSEN